MSLHVLCLMVPFPLSSKPTTLNLSDHPSVYKALSMITAGIASLLLRINFYQNESTWMMKIISPSQVLNHNYTHNLPFVTQVTYLWILRNPYAHMSITHNIFLDIFGEPSFHLPQGSFLLAQWDFTLFGCAKMLLCVGFKADKTCPSGEENTAYLLAALSRHPHAIKFVFFTNIKRTHYAYAC